MQYGQNLGAKPAKNMSWTLRYTIVEPNRVFNWLGMMNVTSWVFFPELRKTWWEEDTVKIRQQIQDLYIEYFDAATGHFSNLERSMLKDGFHAPVNTITGLPRDMYLKGELPLNTLPIEMQDHPNNVLLTHTFGGSRVIIAQKLGIDIPCFIYDFTGVFKKAEELKDSEEVRAKFPTSYVVGGNVKAFPVARAITHTHMEGSNDGKERETRVATIERIRATLTRNGTLT